MPKRRKVGDIAIEIIKENDNVGIGYVDFGLLDEVFSRAREEGIVKEPGSRGGRMRPHPLNRQIVVLNCLDRDKRFKKSFIRCTNGTSEVLTRYFIPKEMGGH